MASSSFSDGDVAHTGLRARTASDGGESTTSASASEPSTSRKASVHDLDPAVVVQSRRGSVLGKGTMLKADHFPGAHNKKLVPAIDGAPNFRQVDGLSVCGVGIPTVRGVANVLDHVASTSNPSPYPFTTTNQGDGAESPSIVHWHNMREEPVLYINGTPYVLREVQRPFANVEYTGIDSRRVEAMERRLKEDVLREVAQFGGVLVCR